MELDFKALVATQGFNETLAITAALAVACAKWDANDTKVYGTMVRDLIGAKEDSI